MGRGSRASGLAALSAQIVEIKTFTLRERYEVLLLRTFCYAAVARRTQNFVQKAFLFCHFLLSAGYKLEFFMRRSALRLEGLCLSFVV